MPFKFNKLWTLLAASNMSKDDLRNKIGASQTTIVNLGKNKNVSLDVIDRICETLKCTPDDIMEFIPTFQPLPKQLINLKKGDIFIANINIDGSESNKPRPVLIYQSNASLQCSQSVMVIPFSNKLAKHNEINTVEIPPLADKPYLQKGALVEITRLTSINRISLIQKIGTLPNELLQQVDQTLNYVLGTKDF